MPHWGVLYPRLMAQPDCQWVSVKNIIGALLVLALHQGPEGPPGLGGQAQCFTPHLPTPGLASVSFLVTALGGANTPSSPVPHAPSPEILWAQAVPAQRQRLFPALDRPPAWRGPSTRV